MGERAARHFGELQARECPHAQAIRAILNDFLRGEKRTTKIENSDTIPRYYRLPTHVHSTVSMG